MYEKPKLWLYWENVYPRTFPPSYIQLCYKTIMGHCGSDFEVILLDHHSIGDYLLPSMMASNVRLFYENILIPQKTDIFRIYLLYYYGGVWLDIDTIVLQSLKKYHNFLVNFDYVGFGCNRPDCSQKPSLSGYGYPSNWCMISRPRGIFITTLFQMLNKRIESSSLERPQDYHMFGRLLLKACYEDCTHRFPDWKYHHVSSKCLERNFDGVKWTNEKLLSSDDILSDPCLSSYVIIPIYNTAPGFPSWFRNMTEEEILNNPSLCISKLFRFSFSKMT